MPVENILPVRARFTIQMCIFDPFSETLSGTEWGKADAINHAVQHFERNAKRKVGVWQYRSGARMRLTNRSLRTRQPLPGSRSAVSRARRSMGSSKAASRFRGAYPALGHRSLCLLHRGSDKVAGFFQSSIEKIKESLEIAFENGGQTADVSTTLQSHITSALDQ
jgi:hypothetical protein